MKQQMKLFCVVGLLILLVGVAAQSAQAANDGGTTVQSSQSSQSAGVTQASTVGDSSTANVPSLETRDAILNNVDLGAPIVLGSNIPVAGPQGGESGPVGLAKPPLSSQNSGNQGTGVSSVQNSGGQSTASASAQSSSSQGTVFASTANIVRQTVQALSNWFSGLLKSIFNT